MLTTVYHAALGIICATAVWLALDPRIPSGIVGTACIGGIAVFSLAATEGDPPNWLVGQMVSLAGLCLWGITRIAWRRHCVTRDSGGEP